MSSRTLRSGKVLGFPSLFLNPQNEMEGELLKLTNDRYPTKPQNLGINYIDGVVISVKEFAEVSRMFHQTRLSEFTERNGPLLEDKVRLVNPSLYFLFQGTKNDKNAMLDTGLFPQSLKEILNDLSTLAKPSEKIDAAIDRIYPLLDTLLIRNLIEFQIQNDSDILILPSVPVTTISKLRFKKQISKVSQMNKTGRILLDTVFKSIRKRKDSMSMLTINTSTIHPKNIDNLIEALIIAEPDHIGITPLNFNEADIPRTRMLLQLIRRIATITGSKIPIHLFNVTELGYVAFCHGTSAMTSPIATDPYFKRRVEQLPPPRCGAYYHPVDMTHDPYDILLEKTRSVSYRLPCHCGICSEYQNIADVPNEYWNKFRRIHFMLVKSMELKELKDSASFLKNSLKDKFARSDRTQWLPFLD